MTTNTTNTGTCCSSFFSYLSTDNLIYAITREIGSLRTCTTNVSSTSPQTSNLSSYGINEIIGAQITEKRATTSSGVSGVSGHWFKVDEETGKKITIYNSSAVNRTYSVLVIAI